MTQRPRETKREARERRAAERLRAEQAAQRRRRITMFTVIGVVAVVVVAAVVIGVVQNNRGAGTGSSSAAGGSPTTFGPSDAKVTVDVWEDPQCPFCGEFERSGGGEYTTSLIKGGQVKVSYHTVTFLDQNFPGQHSLRAANALKCAQAQGEDQFLAYHAKLFASQPAKEGEGWTDQQLIGLGKDAGITTSAFSQCVTNLTYKNQVNATTASMSNHGVTGTPTVFVNGKEVSGATSPDDLVAKVRQAVVAAGGPTTQPTAPATPPAAPSSPVGGATPSTTP